jgi:hypothetical protein
MANSFLFEVTGGFEPPNGAFAELFFIVRK